MEVPPAVPVTAGHIDTAKERLILARATHLDSLIARLQEPRVQRVIEPLLAGQMPSADPAFDADASYVQDLGLIAQGKDIEIANPIYREVIVRVLAAGAERLVRVSPRDYLLPDGQLDFRRLIDGFAAFWRESGHMLAESMPYPEAARQLVFMAYLQRVVNGGGFVDREYGVGRGAIDMLVRKPYGDGQLQREAIELKVWQHGRPDPLQHGLAQLDNYLEGLGLDTGTLVIFDCRGKLTPVSKRTRISAGKTPAGRAVTLLRA
jgi:hypothetical protein